MGRNGANSVTNVIWAAVLVILAVACGLLVFAVWHGNSRVRELNESCTSGHCQTGQPVLLLRPSFHRSWSESAHWVCVCATEMNECE